ncbi:MAG TPA: Mur ligase family protein [bacterium]|nr:Mur ligase family protein [bacterium]HPP88285.1 Mur ligase family protein [bacterium]
MLKTVKDLFDYLKYLRTLKIQLGLERIKFVLDFLNNPQQKIKYIHIAGTNGKGSTAIFCAKFLRAYHKKIGLYISPEIYKYNDRITINDKPISVKKLLHYANIVKSAAVETKQFLTEFEFCTAIMFCYFADERVDFAVIETGLGGRLDATNVGAPIVSILTSIDYDHQEYLGNTLEKICFEKIAIFSRAKYCVVGKISKTKYFIVKNLINSLNINKTIDYFGEEYKIKKSIDKIYFQNRFGKIDITNVQNFPDYQLYNCAAALQAISQIFSDDFFSYNFNEIISKIIFPFRFQTLNQTKPLIIVDNSHNIEAIKFFLRESNKIQRPKICIYSGLKDKNYKDILKMIVKNFDKVFVFNIENERGADLKKFADNNKIFYFANPEEIITFIFSNLKYNYLITGSYYTVRYFIEKLKRQKNV